MFVLVRTPFLSPFALERERLELTALLSGPLMQERFYEATELVYRNRITGDRQLIKKALQERPLRSFHFLICKN